MSTACLRTGMRPSIANRKTHRAWIPMLLSVLALLAGCGPGMSEKDRLDAERTKVVVKAVHVDHQLWVMTAGGVLSSIEDKSSTQKIIKLPGPAVGLWMDGLAPVVLTLDQAGSSWAVLRQNHGTWIRLATISKGEDNFIGGSASKGVNTVLTFHRIIEVSDAGQAEKPVTWSNVRVRGRVASYLLTEDAAYIGFDSGEWGGGLAKIIRQTGAASLIEKPGSKSLCAGPLNAKCDPVHGIVELPWKPGCLAIAIGLEHMLSNGRVAEVCGTDVQATYFDPDPEYQRAGDPPATADELFPSTAFYGIAVIGDQLWVVGTNGIHQVSRNGSATVVPFAVFHRAGEIEFSDAMPEILLVRSRHGSESIMSAQTPLMVPR